MAPEVYRDGIFEGRRRAVARGVEIGWVIDIPRDLEMPDQTVTIDYLESGCTPADDGVFCEVCPTSNLLLGVVDSFDEHPLPRLIEAGLTVCINTDDPGWFDTDLITELTIASDRFGLSVDDHVRLQRHAVEASYASPITKRSIDAELDAFEAAHETDDGADTEAD
ncbi:MAG: hypothetical protein AAFP84_09490 [Actinomycetota bacterium]